MPAANFGKSDYITMALLLGDSDFDRKEFLDQAEEIWVDEYFDEDDESCLEYKDIQIDAIIDDLISKDTEFIYGDTFYVTIDEIRKLDLSDIKLDVFSGYYDGLWLDITMDWYLEDENDRENMYVQIGKLGEFLNNLAENGWRSVSSSCYFTHCDTYEETILHIADAIGEMMDKISNAAVYDIDEPQGSDNWGA